MDWTENEWNGRTNIQRKTFERLENYYFNTTLKKSDSLETKEKEARSGSRLSHSSAWNLKKEKM